MKLSDTRMPYQTDLNTFANDLKLLCHLAQAPYNHHTVENVLSTFSAEFSHQVVEFRTNNKPVGQREVSFRYVDLNSGKNPFNYAVEHHLIEPKERPIDKLIPELESKFDAIMGYGADFSAVQGFEKIWIFFSKLYPIQKAFEINSFPFSVKQNESFLAKHNLTHFNLVACDFHSQTTNIYFPMCNPIFYTKERIAQMIEDAGMNCPNSSMFEYNTKSLLANITYSWSEHKIERLCFYVPVVTADALPNDPLLQEIAQKAPFLSPERMFIVGHTLTPKGDYIKLEIDYLGVVVGLFNAAIKAEKAQ